MTTTRRIGYRAPKGSCAPCRFRPRCAPSGRERTVHRLWEQELVEAALERTAGPKGQQRLQERQVRAEGVFALAERAARAATDEVQRQTEGADSALLDGSSDEPEAGGTSDEQGNAYRSHGQGGPFGRDQVGPSSAKSLSRLLGQQAHLDEYTLLMALP